MEKKLASPNDSNTIQSGMADFFLSQWTYWIIMNHKDKPDRPIYAEWNYLGEGGATSDLFIIDYDNQKLTPLKDNYER